MAGPPSTKIQDRDLQKLNSAKTVQLCNRIKVTLAAHGLLWFVDGGVEFLGRWWVRECFKNNGRQKLVNEGHARMTDLAIVLEEMVVEDMDATDKQVASPSH